MNNNDKSFVYMVNIFVFVLIIFVFAIINLFSPKDNKMSAVENRELASKPELSIETILSGKYSRDFENYFADNFVMREFLVEISMSVNKFKGIPSSENIELVEHNAANVDQGANKTDQSANNGNLLILNDKVMEIYKFNKDKAIAYADMLNKIRSSIGDDIKMYSLLAPVQIEFLSNNKYRKLSDSQYDAIQFVNQNLDKRITAIDAYQKLKDHKDEYVYFRSDHHWTALGAYYAYTAFAQASGVDAIDLDEYKVKEVPGFLGHLSTIQPSDNVNKNPDNVIYYPPIVDSTLKVFFYDPDTNEKKSYIGSVINKTYVDIKQKYGIFLGGDFPLGVIKTNVNTNKKIIVIKDSYGNAFVPFLLPHYSEIYVIDPRHYKENILDLIKENSIDEVLVLNYVLTTNFEAFMESVLKLLTY